MPSRGKPGVRPTHFTFVDLGRRAKGRLLAFVLGSAATFSSFAFALGVPARLACLRAAS